MIMKNAWQQALPVLLLFAGLAHGQVWTSTGSTGIVDELNYADIRFIQNEAQLSVAAASDTTVVLRYNVVAVPGIVGPFSSAARLHIRYKTGNATGSVIVRLKRVGINGGVSSTVREFNSGDFAAAPAYVTRISGDCSSPLALDFTNYAYWVDVELKKGASGSPALAALKIDTIPGCPG